jgi:hypothetical protein
VVVGSHDPASVTAFNNDFRDEPIEAGCATRPIDSSSGRDFLDCSSVVTCSEARFEFILVV